MFNGKTNGVNRIIAGSIPAVCLTCLHFWISHTDFCISRPFGQIGRLCTVKKPPSITRTVKKYFYSGLVLHNSSSVTSKASASFIALSTVHLSRRIISSTVRFGKPALSASCWIVKPFLFRIFWMLMLNSSSEYQGYNRNKKSD